MVALSTASDLKFVDAGVAHHATASAESFANQPLVVEVSLSAVESAVASLLSMKHLPWHHQRDTGRRSYDLRTLIDDLWLIDWHHPYATIGMRLRCDNSGSGRPEQVAAALGFTHYPQTIHRTKLVLKTS